MTEWLLPQMDLARCVGCGLCAQHCPHGVVEMLDAKPVVRKPEACTYCGECEMLCPVDAVDLQYEIILPSSSGASQ